jgi:hypothetical protein
MYNGSLKSLGEVIYHYASGGKKNYYQSNFIKEFEITQNERSALITLLETLTEIHLLNKEK